MGSQNRTKDHNKRRQKAALKAKKRVGKVRAQPNISSGMIAAMAAALFPDSEWIYWASHGANCLLSDYSKGTWTPMFEGIYEGQIPTPTDVFHALVAKYGSDNDSWSPDAKAALAWVAQSRETSFIYKTACVDRLKLKGVEDPEDEARLPHNSTVWGVFEELKASLLARKSI